MAYAQRAGGEVTSATQTSLSDQPEIVTGDLYQYKRKSRYWELWRCDVQMKFHSFTTILPVR
jgi:hypothetical protein